MAKTQKNIKIGGKVIASGGYGCVFKPALKCKGSTKRDNNKITKLMTNNHAKEEYEEINNIKGKLDGIPNYENYFVLNDIKLCHLSKLDEPDLVAFSKKCRPLSKKKITKTNINDRLNEIMGLNVPDSGLPVDDYIYVDGSLEKIYNVHNKLIKLLKNGIIPMNEKHIYHSDIKDSNVLIDKKHEYARLIDWGLTVEYNPASNSAFPKNWRNRPFQFNLPFSVIIFSDDFYDKYSNYLNNKENTSEKDLKPFVIDYVQYWLKKRGPGHYKVINEIMFMLYSNTFKDISEKNIPLIIETEITMPFIVNYITNVLVHYTKFKEDGKLNLREYLNDVYIKIIDIYGFLNIYFPLLEYLHNNFSKLSNDLLKIFDTLKIIYIKYLYEPRHKAINMDELFEDLNLLGKVIQDNVINTNKQKHISIGGIKTRKYYSIKNKYNNYSIKKKYNKNKNNIIIFKRKNLNKRFKSPLFLSLLK